IHGHISKLNKLWSNLQSALSPSDFSSALVIFLGDYCDRGPETQQVIDLLIKLPEEHPDQTHVFLAGNHDFAFAGFLGLLPPPLDGSEFKDTWDEFERNEEREGWYNGEGFEDMHVQGRRWAGTIRVQFDSAIGVVYNGSIYDAGSTFESYGVPHGSPDLIKAVPKSHKKFFEEMVWVHEEEDVCVETEEGLKQCKLIAVHAGLERRTSVNEQLELLRARDTSIPKIQPLSGRRNVWDIPQELDDKQTVIVSGHHGKLHIDGLRLIVDESGGYPDIPLAAIILPSKKIIRDTDPRGPQVHYLLNGARTTNDIHGYISKLDNLWSNLQSAVNPSDFSSALVIFLGDYCDRGPETRKVIDFLISLPEKHPDQTHVFLAGNHDFAFAGFLGLLPSPSDGSDLKDTWNEFKDSEEREGWYRGEGFEDMHLQGRRWAGKIKAQFNSVKGMAYKGSIYDAGSTFESYGVPHGSSDLMKAVPESHKKFLSNMVWVHEEDDVCIETEEGLKHCKLIAVHAGLEKGNSVDEQLKLLRAKDTSISKVPYLSGRKNVWDIPQELDDKQTLVVSGHHGKLHIDGLRLIIDEGGGYPEKPVAAIVLPSQKIIRDTDHVCS
ncbi:unnamed protein product, partial [Thlaspi arvense]